MRSELRYRAALFIQTALFVHTMDDHLYSSTQTAESAQPHPCNLHLQVTDTVAMVTWSGASLDKDFELHIALAEVGGDHVHNIAPLLIEDARYALLELTSVGQESEHDVMTLICAG